MDSGYRVRCALDDIEKVVKWSNEGSECKRGYLLPAVQKLAIHAPETAIDLLFMELGQLRRTSTEINESRSLAMLELARCLAGNPAFSREKPEDWLDAGSVRLCLSILDISMRRQAIVCLVSCFIRDILCSRARMEKDPFSDLPIDTMFVFIQASKYNDPDRIFASVIEVCIQDKHRCFHFTDLVRLYMAIEKTSRERFDPFRHYVQDYLESYCLSEGGAFDWGTILRLATDHVPADERRDVLIAKTYDILQRQSPHWLRSLASCLMRLYKP